MNFQKIENGRLHVVDLPNLYAAEELARSFFDINDKAAEFTILKMVKGAQSFTVKGRHRDILFQLKQLKY